MNNKTQAVVCDDLGMQAYAVYANPKELLKVKDRADLLEAFLGALYIDRVRVVSFRQKRMIKFSFLTRVFGSMEILKKSPDF